MFIIFKVKKETEQQQLISNSVDTQKKGFSKVRIDRVEINLGIVDYCLDLDIYKINNDFYVVMGCTSEGKEKFIKNKSENYIIISFEEFKEQIKNEFDYTSFGTGIFHKQLLSQLE